MKKWLLIAALTTPAFLAGPAFADPSNLSFPAGPIILNLDGTPISHSFTTYTASFVADSTSTNLSFAFRDDPSFLYLDNVVLTMGGGPNLVTNGDFEPGPINASAPAGWTYLNSFGAAYGGFVASGCGNPNNCYYDGAVQAYDAITQVIATTIGATYDLKFDLREDSGLSTYSALSTNGDVTSIDGNGINLVVYAGQPPHANGSVPEPLTLSLFGAGLAGAVAMRRRKAKTA